MLSLRVNQRNRTSGRKDLLQEIGSHSVRGWLDKSETPRTGHQGGQAGTLRHKLTCSPKAAFLPPQGSLSSALKAFHLIVSDPPRLSWKFSFIF